MENDSIIKSTSQLSLTKQTVMRELWMRPQQYFSSLTTSTPTLMIKADTPNLWEVRNSIGETKTRAVVVYALAWLAQLVNVERNLTDVQIGEIASDMINDYGYFKVEEIKYIFKRAVKSEKFFGRLDYNIVMGWIKDYDNERTEHCIDISNQEETEKSNRISVVENAVTWNSYINSLWNLALYADEQAVEYLSMIEDDISPIAQIKDAQHSNKLGFKQYYFNEYLKNKTNNERTNNSAKKA